MQKRSIPVMIVLSFVTCGIYNLFWMYLSRREFKRFSGYADINPDLELLFSLFCIPYFFYWLYKFSSDIAKYQAQTGKPVSNNAALNLILAIFGLGLISELIIQSQLNDLVG